MINPKTTEIFTGQHGGSQRPSRIRQEGQDIMTRDEGSSCCLTSTMTHYSLWLWL